MKQLCLLVVLAALAALTYRASAPRRSDEAAQAAELGCTCAQERVRNGWCESCDVGYVAEIEVRSKLVYETLDPHGHDILGPKIPCERCREAARDGGFCDACGRGFVGGRAYLSPLAYHLARGERALVEDELAVLRLALETAGRCETCAAAMVVDGTCPRCRISYRDGRATER